MDIASRDSGISDGSLHIFSATRRTAEIIEI